MSFANTRAGYGWAAIALHWISAAGVIVLYLLGERMEEAPDRAAKLAAMASHVSVGVLLFAFLAARVLWSLSQPRPAPIGAGGPLRLLAETVQVLFLAMIAVQLVTGPLVIWSNARPVEVFDWFAIASPFAAPVEWLHEAAEEVHKLAPSLLWPLLGLHVLGALKHTLIDRDGTLRRMLWSARGA
ncbi:cytochrome b561 family protein [Phenylobacterium zucineum HLK1]|uniref:Cytochrome b561 family protein n=1 Tax=Phenylobacterium zucineum (strain HLK1) TaxID=450851 RepID=B4RH79_PHEZH|nr:cytochrome b [Phenylobacterium zucineum]ACG79027.1 cytochrome b561 family protein [Phenylobacterium zucineum HLK1]